MGSHNRPYKPGGIEVGLAAQTARNPSGRHDKGGFEYVQVGVWTHRRRRCLRARHEEVIGAAGVSGAPGGEKDEACVKAALDKVADQLK